MKAQDYYGASNMSVPKSGVGQQLQKERPSALCSHYLFHSLHLSVKSVNAVSRTMKEMMDVCLEKVRVFKFSPKRERFLGKTITNAFVISFPITFHN